METDSRDAPEAAMSNSFLYCFDCDEPLSDEALQFHPARCAACALADYAREEEEQVREQNGAGG